MKQGKVIALLFCCLLFLALHVVPTAQAADTVEFTREYFRGRVLSITNIVPTDGFASLEQRLEVKVTSGEFEGDIVALTNYYMEGEIYLALYLEEGDSVILGALLENGKLTDIHLHDIARDRGLFYLLGIFVILILLIGRKQGAKTIITLAFTGIVIFVFLLPLLLAGHEPLPLSVAAAAVIAVFTLLVIGGVNLKSFSAIVGTVFGVVVAGFLAFWIGRISFLTGFSTEEAQMLYFLETEINIRGLLFAGIIIGTLGAVTDVGMSVASAAAEIKEVNPRIKVAELTGAALNVGRDIMGTMANTLILAYVGAALPLLLLLIGFQDSWLRVFNMDLIATEIVRGVAGSIGLIVSIPVTALTAGFLMGRKG